MAKKRGKRVRSSRLALAIEPTPQSDRELFVPYSLERFLAEKALWAANYFVLWPIGLALTADVEVVDGFVVKVSGLHVREWVMPDGEKKESIDQAMTVNREDYKLFLAFVRERLLEMKSEDRRLAMGRLAEHGIAMPDQILAVEP